MSGISIFSRPVVGKSMTRGSIESNRGTPFTAEKSPRRTRFVCFVYGVFNSMIAECFEVVTYHRLVNTINLYLLLARGFTHSSKYENLHNIYGTTYYHKYRPRHSTTFYILLLSKNFSA